MKPPVLFFIVVMVPAILFIVLRMRKRN